MKKYVSEISRTGLQNSLSNPVWTETVKVTALSVYVIMPYPQVITKPAKRSQTKKDCHGNSKKISFSFYEWEIYETSYTCLSSNRHHSGMYVSFYEPGNNTPSITFETLEIWCA